MSNQQTQTSQPDPEADLQHWRDIVRRLRQVHETLVMYNEVLCSIPPSSERERVLNATAQQQERIQQLFAAILVSGTSSPMAA